MSIVIIVTKFDLESHAYPLSSSLTAVPRSEIALHQPCLQFWNPLMDPEMPMAVHPRIRSLWLSIPAGRYSRTSVKTELFFSHLCINIFCICTSSCARKIPQRSLLLIESSIIGKTGDHSSLSFCAALSYACSSSDDQQNLPFSSIA